MNVCDLLSLEANKCIMYKRIHTELSLNFPAKGMSKLALVERFYFQL